MDGDGNAYLTGYTGSSEAEGFPVTVGPDLTHNGYMDAFVAKVNAAGTGLDYCGYIGGGFEDYGYDIAVDGEGNAYVTGWTSSTEASFPVVEGPDLTYNGGDRDAFVARVRADGTELDYCGYIGGSGNDEYGHGIAVDGEGNAYVTGYTNSTEASFPVVVGPDLTHNGNTDTFVAKISWTAPPTPAPVLELEKEARGDTSYLGERIAYLITVSNLSSETLSHVLLTDTLPSQQRPVAVTSDQGSCIQSGGWGGTITCDLGNIVAGNPVQIALTTEVTRIRPATLPLTMRNTVQAEAENALGKTSYEDVELREEEMTLRPVGYSRGPAHGIVVQGQYAYVAEGATLAIIDISDQANPRRVGYVTLPYYATDVAVSGDYAYVTTMGDTSRHPSGGGLYVVSIADKRRPVIVGSYEVDYYALSVAIAGEYAYIVVPSWWGYRFLIILSVADPTHPTEVGDYGVSPYSWNLHVADGYAYVAAGKEGLQIISVTDPTNPTLVTTYDATKANDVYVVGDYAYVAGGFDGLVILSIADKAHPVEVGRYDPGEVNGVYVVGDYAYLCGSGMMVVSVADPAHPTLIGSTDGPTNGTGYVSGDYAYIAAHLYGYGGSIWVFSVADPAHPTFVTQHTALFDISGAQRSGEYAYVSDRSGSIGLAVVSLADLENPTIVATWGEFQATQLQVVGDYVYILHHPYTIKIVSVHDPLHPVQVGAYETGVVQDFYTMGDYLYVCSDRLEVVSIADKAHPTLVGSADLSGSGLYGTGNMLYVADGKNGLHIVSVADPTHPVQVGLYDTEGRALDVYVVGDYAYVADKYGLAVLSVADPAHPIQVSYLDIEGGQAQGIYVVGDYAYVAAGTRGLRVISIIDPAHPVEVTFHDVGGAVDVYADEEYIYVADPLSGLLILQPASPTLQAAPSGITWMVAAGGSDPAPRTVRVESGFGVLTWTATLNPDVSWLEATPLSGNTPATITLSAHISGLTVGKYETQLVIEAEEEAKGSPQIIPVTLIVAEEVYGSYLPLVVRD
ncbi:MAG: hypothetical protein DRI61_03650 [Chloroflexi bacterium]|nr:MAG: hypothetical protein DRI61_03650 [Chloroflexota bacterium]